MKQKRSYFGPIMRSDALVEKMIMVDKIQHMRWITVGTVKYLQELCTVARGRRVGELFTCKVTRSRLLLYGTQYFTGKCQNRVKFPTCLWMIFKEVLFTNNTWSISAESSAAHTLTFVFTITATQPFTPLKNLYSSSIIRSKVCKSIILQSLFVESSKNVSCRV